MNALSLFDGPTEMHARRRAFDWAATPLGAPDCWPVELHATVRRMLDDGTIGGVLSNLVDTTDVVALRWLETECEALLARLEQEKSRRMSGSSTCRHSSRS